MKTIRNLFLIAALAASFTAKAGLQVDGTLTGGTNRVAANTTNTFAGTPFYLGRTTDATFAFTFNCSGASTANYTLALDASIDNANWLTNALMWQVAGNGASTNTFLTNLPAGQRFPYYRTSSVWNTNAATTAISNIAVKVFTKDGF